MSASALDGLGRAALYASCSSPAPRLPHAAHEMFTRVRGAHGSLFVSDVHRIAYMAIPRAASTTLRGAMRDLGGAFRRLEAVFNNSAALHPSELSEAQRSYFTFTFVSEPLHHLVDGFAFVQSGGPEGAFNGSAGSWQIYQRSLAQAHRRSADWMRTNLFWNPHLVPQAHFLGQRWRHGPRAAGGAAEGGADASARLRFDFIGEASATGFARDWSLLLSTLRSRGHQPAGAADDLQLGRYGARISSAERRSSLHAAAQPRPPSMLPAAFDSAVGEEALLGLCRIRYQEYACLGHAPPAPCARPERQRALRERTGWVF